jgi:hypothetical protein
MTDEEWDTLWGLLCLVAFLVGLAALLQHPEWFG